MLKLVIALVLIAAVLLSGLMRLLRTRNQPMGTPEQLERARLRNLELEEQERREREQRH